MNKQQLILQAIRNGGATDASLMECADLKKAGLSSQIAYLNARGRAMAEVDTSRAEFPLKDANGVYYMGTFEEFQVKQETRPKGNLPTMRRALTLEAAIDFATKREAKAATALDKANTKFAATTENSTVLAVWVEVCERTLQYESMRLSLVESADFSLETFTLAPAPEVEAEAETDEFVEAEPQEGWSGQAEFV